MTLNLVEFLGEAEKVCFLCLKEFDDAPAAGFLVVLQLLDDVCQNNLFVRHEAQVNIKLGLDELDVVKALLLEGLARYFRKVHGRRDAGLLFPCLLHPLDRIAVRLLFHLTMRIYIYLCYQLVPARARTRKHLSKKLICIKLAETRVTCPFVAA